MTHQEHLQAAESPEDVDIEVAGWVVEHVGETGSTQADLLDRAETGALIDRTVRYADFQRDGRGRLDRTWQAPPGANLLVSFGFVGITADPTAVMRRLGVAVVVASRQFGVRGVGLKWPNDLEVDGAKVGGMLAQRVGTGEIVVGLGLNIGWAPPDAAALADAVSNQAAANQEALTIESLTPHSALRRILLCYDEFGDDWERVEERYRSELDTIGREVRVDLGERTVLGTATGVDSGGQLIVVDVDGNEQIVAYGDVIHLRRWDQGFR